MATKQLSSKTNQQKQFGADIYSLVISVLETAHDYFNMYFRILSDPTDKSHISIAIDPIDDKSYLAIELRGKKVQITGYNLDPGPKLAYFVKRALKPRGIEVSVKLSGVLEDSDDPALSDFIVVYRVPKDFDEPESAPWGKVVARMIVGAHVEDVVRQMKIWAKLDRVKATAAGSTTEVVVYIVANCIIVVHQIDATHTQLTLHATQKDKNHVWGYRVHAEGDAIDAWNQLGKECVRLSWTSNFPELGVPRLLLPSELDDMVVTEKSKAKWKKSESSFGHATSTLEREWLRYRRVVKWGNDRIHDEEAMTEHSPEEAAEIFLKAAQLSGEQFPTKSDCAGRKVEQIGSQGLSTREERGERPEEPKVTLESVGEEAFRAAWCQYKYDSDKYHGAGKRFTHKDLADKLDFSEQSAKNYYNNVWRPQMKT